VEEVEEAFNSMPCYRTHYLAPAATHVHADRDFSLPGDTAHYPPDRPVDVRHVALDLTVNFKRKNLHGTCTTTFGVLFEEIREVTLRATELQIASIQFSSKRRPQEIDLNWDYDGEYLRIALDRPLRFGNEFKLTIAYQTTPRIGMNFVGPTDGDPQHAIQAHTQGQPEFAHYWFPCHDSPNDRFTFACAARVPANMFAVSNGRLEKIEDHPESDERTFYYYESVPFPAYITTLAVGEFTEQRDDFGETPVLYYARPGLEHEARLMMGDTPAMMAYYSERFGVRYPYEKYAQVILESFTGAMENTSATSHSWLLMPNDRFLPDWDYKSVVAHELVHQWFGDLMTCRDWSHAWLNESFATYFEETWKQADPTAGELEFRLGMRYNQRNYLSEDAIYRRSIVYNVYSRDGQELFDRHLYEKGSCVLHMLRGLLGEKSFWRGIQHYARTNRGREVITADLERALEESTGKSLGRFFDQWVYHGGHPDFEVDYSWDNDQKLASVTVKQVQKITELTPLFTTPVEIAFTLAGKSKHETKSFTVTVSQPSETFVFPLDRRPELVRFDPYGWILKSLKFDRPVSMLRWQLANDNDPIGRIDAAELLAEKDDAATMQALVTAMTSDSEYAVRVAAARALGQIANATALDALLSAVTTEQHSKARRAIVEALGSFQAPKRAAEAERVAAKLRDILTKGDPSYMVEYEAAISLGRTRTNGAFATLKESVNRSSWLYIVAAGVLQGIGELGSDEAAYFLADWIVDRTHPMLTRANRIGGAASGIIALINTKRIAKDSPAHLAIRDALYVALEDPWISVRLRAAMALRLLGDSTAIPALEQALSRELDSFPRRQIRLALHALRKGKNVPEEVRQVRHDLEDLREENRKLRERLALIEAKESSNGHVDGNGHANGVTIKTRPAKAK
jgi:aminopeptidase N